MKYIPLILDCGRREECEGIENTACSTMHSLTIILNYTHQLNTML